MAVPRGTRVDVVVVGAGHAGCEAALACGRLGCRVVLISLDLERVAEMSCNPAIGGLGKSQIVREIDALGGEMARAADAAAIHFRRLNLSRGPAVRARRVQCDLGRYQRHMRAALDACPGVELLQGCAQGLMVEDRGRVVGVELEDGSRIAARAVILTTGTFLRGRMFTGLEASEGGRVGDRAAVGMGEQLQAMGLRMGRLKTGTPPRLAADSVDLQRLERQDSDVPILPFAHGGHSRAIEHAGEVACRLTRTNARTHAIIRGGLERSPLFSGRIQGRGPRYCPSIEDKVVRFADRDSHQVVLEPVDLDGHLLYPNGISTSLPLDVQRELVRSIDGLERARIAQPGYAVEYDFVQPTQLGHDLMLRDWLGLFLAGQINGTSGYEEAAGQGLLAGLNAVAHLRSDPALVLGRHQAYLGVMVDDLISRGTQEPYRMFSSRAEFRLLLREDNAFARLHPVAESIGLVPAPVLAERGRAMEQADGLRERLRSERSTPERNGRRPTLERVLRRPGITLPGLLDLSTDGLQADVLEMVEVEVKYAGYVQRQLRDAQRLAEMDARPIPMDLDFSTVDGLSSELQAKLDQSRPSTFGQARLLDGMTPAGLLVLAVFLDHRRQKGDAGDRARNQPGGNVPRGTTGER